MKIIEDDDGTEISWGDCDGEGFDFLRRLLCPLLP